MADIDSPDDLIELERSAWAAIQDGSLTVDAALAVREGVAAFVAREKEAGREVARYAVEMGLKKLVRHPEAA
ncbi:hypothetical protein [Streptomyces sp. NPDC101249]|uniref:hypothetical protein n=1 Tax=Streptomyces sp. NPDC101249 TaxID=3366140 RepID=UPI00382DF058